jgi:hypothetical protein
MSHTTSGARCMLFAEAVRGGTLHHVDRTTGAAPMQLTELVYELLDAHTDTVRLVDEPGTAGWGVHLEYLRDLQRVGREVLAHAS